MRTNNRIKEELIDIIHELINTKRLELCTQKDIAGIIGMSQPRLSNLINIRELKYQHLFSLDKLIEVIQKLKPLNKTYEIKI